MSLSLLDALGSLASIFGLLIGMPTVLATLYQAVKARQEVKKVREGSINTRDCLEFVTRDGSCVNVVPLETLHSLPKEGDVILLPGQGAGSAGQFLPGAYLVDSIEHIYSPATHKASRIQEARLTKAVAHVTSLNPSFGDSLFERGGTEEQAGVS